MKRLKFNKLTIMLLVIILVVCSVFSANLVSADNVVILEEVNPTFEKAEIGDGDPWKATTEYSEENGKYNIRTNSYVIWFGADDFDYFYKRYAFNYGKKAEFFAETTVESWQQTTETSSAGIVLRSSLKADAATVFLHIRGNGICIVYRAQDGKECSVYVDKTHGYPVSLRLEVKNKIAYGYYKLSNSTNWIKLNATIPFGYTDAIYAGIGAHASANVMCTAVFDGFKTWIEAPEGTVVEGDTSSGENTESDEIKLPADMPVTEDVLLSETFTDGNMFPDIEEVTNPIWRTDNPEPNIITNADNTDREIFLELENGYYYYAGDEDNWYDYSTTFDLNISENSAYTEKNIFNFYVRRRYSEFNGSFYYGVRFEYNPAKMIGTVSIISDEYARITAAPDVLESIELDYLSEEFTGVDHKVKIDAFDNCLTVYIDDMQTPVLSHTVEDLLDFKGNGGIGFMSQNAVVTLDNIEVRKLEDYIGGDYDNRISGNFDKQIPDYVNTFSENEWEY